MMQRTTWPEACSSRFADLVRAALSLRYAIPRPAGIMTSYSLLAPSQSPSPSWQLGAGWNATSPFPARPASSISWSRTLVWPATVGIVPSPVTMRAPLASWMSDGGSLLSLVRDRPGPCPAWPSPNGTVVYADGQMGTDHMDGFWNAHPDAWGSTNRSIVQEYRPSTPPPSLNPLCDPTDTLAATPMLLYDIGSSRAARLGNALGRPPASCFASVAPNRTTQMSDLSKWPPQATDGSSSIAIALDTFTSLRSASSGPPSSGPWTATSFALSPTAFPSLAAASPLLTNGSGPVMVGQNRGTLRSVGWHWLLLSLALHL